MSDLRKSLFTSNRPPRSCMGRPQGSLSGKRVDPRSRVDFTPILWSNFFSEKRDVSVDNNKFRIYLKGEGGPCLVLIHGGGYSALTWAVLSSQLNEFVECQILAIDLRGHGDSITTDDNDLCIGTLTNDVVAVINAVLPGQTPVVLVGHSLGGSIAVHAGHHPDLQSLIGLVVIDVVEGTALGALSSMQSILRGRPQHFNSIDDAIKWSVTSGQVKNIDSAKVSMPGQIKNNKTGLPATVELQNNTVDEGPTPDGANNSPLPMIGVESISEEEESQFKAPGQVTGRYGWRIDLRATEVHWPGWFQGLSRLFLSCSAQKLLLLASLDRLDTDLTVAQMQGKFEIHAFEQSRGRCGHTVHEDIPDAVAEVLANYLVRNKFAVAKSSFQGTLPCC